MSWSILCHDFAKKLQGLWFFRCKDANDVALCEDLVQGPRHNSLLSTRVRRRPWKNKEGFLTGFWWVSLFPSGKHLLPPIAIAITFRIPSRCLMPQTYSKWHIGQSQTVWWWILGECNENTMRMQCPSAISDLNISESNNVKLGLDCLIAWQSGYRFPFCPHLSKALFIHNTVSEVDGSRQRYLSLIYIYLL